MGTVNISVKLDEETKKDDCRRCPIIVNPAEAAKRQIMS